MSGFAASEGALHDAARRACGLEDFGAGDYLEALRVLLDSLDAEASLSEAGEASLRGLIVEALRGRLLSERGFAQAPESADCPIERPLVIVGLPRTGSTALQHLICQDAGVQGLELWLSMRPQVRPPRASWPELEDYRDCEQQLAAQYASSPALKAAHFMSAELPDECWRLLAQHFVHSSWEAYTDVPSFSRWYAHCDTRAAYRRHRRNLQLVGHREPARRWVMKDATHLFHFDDFLTVYPDALVIQTHRDPVKLVASVCSLCWSARRGMNSVLDRRAFGRSTLALWQRAIERSMAARAQRDPAQFYDLHFREFTADPLAAIERIYAHFDIPYSDEARHSIQRFRSAHPQGQHGSHAYTLEEYGLDPDEIRERFRDYTDTFGVEPEPNPRDGTR